MGTKHPAPKGAQREAFEAIAIGSTSPAMAPATRDALLRKGLIEEIEPRMLGGRFPVRIRQFLVPTPLHMKYCAWCSEQP